MYMSMDMDVYVYAYVYVYVYTYELEYAVATWLFKSRLWLDDCGRFCSSLLSYTIQTR